MPAGQAPPPGELAHLPRFGSQSRETTPAFAEDACRNEMQQTNNDMHIKNRSFPILAKLTRLQYS
jgi:hypothetical protein